MISFGVIVVAATGGLGPGRLTIAFAGCICPVMLIPFLLIHTEPHYGGSFHVIYNTQNFKDTIVLQHL